VTVVAVGVAGAIYADTQWRAPNAVRLTTFE